MEIYEHVRYYLKRVILDRLVQLIDERVRIEGVPISTEDTKHMIDMLTLHDFLMRLGVPSERIIHGYNPYKVRYASNYFDNLTEK